MDTVMKRLILTLLICIIIAVCTAEALQYINDLIRKQIGSYLEMHHQYLQQKHIKIVTENYHNVDDIRNGNDYSVERYQKKEEVNQGFEIDRVNRKNGTYEYYDSVTGKYRELDGIPLESEIDKTKK